MTKVVVEEEQKAPLAAVYYGGALGDAVAKELKNSDIIVRRLETRDKDIPFWDKPEYVVTFEGETIQVNDQVVKILGRVKHDKVWIEETAGKIVRFMLSGKQKELLIIGDRIATLGEPKVRKTLKETLARFELKKPKKPNKNRWVGVAILCVVLLLSFPLFWLVGTTVVGFGHLLAGATALRMGNTFEVREQVGEAKKSFLSSENVVRFGWGGLAERYAGYLTFGEKVGDSLEAATRVVDEIEGRRFSDLKLDLARLDSNLGFVDGRLSEILTPGLTKILNLGGLSNDKIEQYREQIKQGRQVVKLGQTLLANLNEIFPTEQGQSKTYLVVFQNSAELRPTGGFIGSYALVSFDSGEFAGYKIYDIYAADGNLKGHIQPPDEILHYLGQPDWFMRDSNWAPDFSLTAQRLQWFLEKETGQNVAGVIGVDLGATKKILSVTGPITLASGQEVTADNFFEKAEYAAEINFFPGSKQKPTFLTNIAQAILDKLASGQVDRSQLVMAGAMMLAEKNVLLYTNSPTVEKTIKENGWGGAIDPQGLMIVEANLGANKANYFIKRSVQVDQEISKGGDVDTTVKITYRNESPNNTWPGGIYKNYIRFLIPKGSKVATVSLGDGREASFSGTLTADIIAAVPNNQFLVTTLPEQEHLSVGTYIEVPVLGDKTISFKYRLPTRLDFGLTEQLHKFIFVRQPGSGNDVLDYALNYPSFLSPVFLEKPVAEVSVLALPQKLVYNTTTRIDRTIEVKFRRN